jgi:hypothetical protein
MAEFTFNLNQIKGAITDPGAASTFTIKGPAGLTQAQAFEIFKQQVSSGALVGYKPGDALSAATQAADGLPSAQSLLTQAQAGAAKIGAGISGALSSIAGAGGATGGSVAGTLPGLTGTVGPAVSSISGAVSQGISQGSALVKAAIAQGSAAIASVQTINKTITNTPVTLPINAADFTKITAGLTSGPAVSSIGPMSVPEVNGVLAQAKNLVGQAANKLSNSKGLGEFGLSVNQLETAGFVKPGTSALVTAGTNTVASILKSPSVFTGKDGIKSASDLLNNPGKQSLIQQDLMTKGVASLGAVGVPVKNLSSQGLAGMALNAAKDLPSAEAFVKGLPLSPDLQAEFSKNIRDGAFAVNLVNTKLPTAFKQEDTPVPSADTVSRGSVDAASNRVLGNDKIPTPNYGPSNKTENEADIEEFVNKAAKLINEYINVAGRGFSTVKAKIEALANQQSITQQQYDAVNNEYQTIRQNYNSTAPALASEVFAAYDRLTPAQQKAAQSGPVSTTKISSSVQYIVGQSKEIKELLKQLSLKIEGRGANE